MKILVTGGAGYIGSHCVKLLNEKDYNVIVYDSLENGYKKAVPNNVKFIKGNVGDIELLNKVFKENKIDAVMNFSGYIEVEKSMKEPLKFYENNVLHGYNLLKIMLKNNVKKIVYSSSASVYGNPKNIPIKEDTLLQPNNVYGETKLIFERMCEYFNKKGLKFICLRYFNAAGANPSGEIGEAHKPETHLIPIILETGLGKRDSFNLYGNNYKTKDGSCVRDFIHVNDLASAHILSLEKLDEVNGNFNVGSGKGYSVKEVINNVKKITNKEIKVDIMPRREGDPAELVADCNKIKKVLGWKAKYSELNNIIKDAWNWHKKHPNGFKE